MSTTPRTERIMDNIAVAISADTREQSIAHKEEAKREIEQLETELYVMQSDLSKMFLSAAARADRNVELRCRAEKAETQVARLRAEVERLKKQIKDDNRSYGCELRDPNGTIWEQASKDHARAEKAEADTAWLDWISVSDVWFDIPATGAFTPETMRAAIDAYMKKEASK